MKRLNAKGLTLVELIIAISMSTIVVAAAALFLYNSQNSYRNAQYAINMQTDTQLVMERLSDWIMECNYIRVETYGPNESQALVLYYGSRDKMDMKKAEHDMIKTDTKRKMIFLKDDRLLLQTDENDSEYIAAHGDMDKEILKKAWHISDVIKSDIGTGEMYWLEDLIVDNVDYFRITNADGSEIKDFDPNNPLTKIRIELHMRKGHMKDLYEYTASDTFSLRNETVDKILFTPEEVKNEAEKKDEEKKDEEKKEEAP